MVEMKMISSPSMTQEEALKVVAEYFKPQYSAQQAASPQVKKYDFVDEWMEHNFYIPETEYLIRLEPFQRIVLRLMFHDPRFNPATVLWTQPKKSGKTAIAGGVARWAAETWGKYNEIINLASDEEQARGRIYAALVQSIQLDPRFIARGDGGELPGLWRIIKNKATHIPTGTTVVAVPSNYRGQAGSNPTLSLWTELHNYTSEAHMRLWSELTPSPVRPRSMRFVETYAGYVNESKLLWSLWEDATNPKQGAIRLTRDDVPDWPTEYHKIDGSVVTDNSYELPLYWNPIARVFGFVDTGVEAHRLPWQTDEYYRVEMHDLKDPLQYERLHLNQWVSSTSAFMPIEWYKRQILPSKIDFPPGWPVELSIDAAVSGDCCAQAAFSRHPDYPDQVVLRGSGYSQIWYPPVGGQFDYGSTIEPAIRNAVRELNVVQCCYDQYQMHDLMTRLRHEALTWFYEFGQSNPRTEADKQLYDLFMERRIWIEPDVPIDFKEHFENADKKQSLTEDTKMRIVKRSDEAKIDGVITCSMGANRCLYLNI